MRVSPRAVPHLGGFLLGGLVFVAALAIWEVWARTENFYFLPPVSEVMRRAWEVWPSADFLSAVGASLKRLAAGFILGSGAAVAVGLAMGSSPRVRSTLGPTAEFLRALPVIAVVPIAIVLLGVGDAMRIGVIAFGVFFPVLVATVEGVRAVAPEVRDSAALYRLSRVEQSTRVYLPAALPTIFAGLRTALSIGLVLVVISEFTGEGDGLGVYIEAQRALFNIREVYVGVVFLGLLGYVLNRLFLLLERRVLAWHHGAVGEPSH
jgi:ABC-type nitrate/sulfonate/bicarbonate transport system permease component